MATRARLNAPRPRPRRSGEDYLPPLLPHYPKNSKAVSTLTEAELEENFNIFAAYRLPENCRRHFGDVHTSVNTLRVVLACLDGTGPELLGKRLFAVHYPYWPSGGHVREWRLK